jgi:hypothetical protein
MPALIGLHSVCRNFQRQPQDDAGFPGPDQGNDVAAGLKNPQYETSY